MVRISEIILIHQPEQPALIIEAVCDVSKMGQVISDSYAKITAYLTGLGEIPASVPFVMYPDFEIDESAVEMSIGFKTSRKIPGKNEIKSFTFPSQKIVSCLHRGSYPQLAEIYREMTKWIKSKGYHGSGASVEYYFTNSTFPDNEHVTLVEMPLRKK